jgi:HEAT repeat protein
MDQHLPIDDESRRQALVALAGRPIAEIADALLAAMGDESWRVRKEAVEMLLAAGEVGDDLVFRLVELLAAEDNAGLRNSASEALERLGARAVKGLCASLTVADIDVRKFVVDILGAIGDKTAVLFLLPVLDDLEPNIVAAVVETLGKIADPSAGSALIGLLQRDDLLLQFTILEALGQLKCPVPLAAIVSLLENPLLKKAAYDCLGAVGGHDAVPLLIKGLSDKGRSAREAAFTAIIRLRDRLPEREIEKVDVQLQALAGSPLVESLLTALDSAELPFKRALVRLLGLTRDGRAMVPLLKAAQNEDVDRECQLAIHEIGGAGIDALVGYFPIAADSEKQQIIQICVSLGMRTCGAILADGARSIDPDVRQRAIAAIGHLVLTEQLSYVVDALDDQDIAVHTEAVGALVRMAAHATEQVRPVAVRLAESPSPKDRSAAARLLFAVDCRERLYFLLKDEEALVRMAAVTALAQDCSAEAINAITLALMDEKPEVRIAAAQSLGACGNADVTDQLILLLADRDQRVQRTVLRTLGMLGNQKAESAITQLIETSSGLLHIQAMESLVALVGAAAMSVIERQLQSSDDEVVKAAIFLMAATDPQRLADHHLSLMQHAHWEVRSSMARALSNALGADAASLLRTAHDQEPDEYVKSQISLLLDRIA